MSLLCIVYRSGKSDRLTSIWRSVGAEGDPVADSECEVIGSKTQMNVNKPIEESWRLRSKGIYIVLARVGKEESTAFSLSASCRVAIFRNLGTKEIWFHCDLESLTRTTVSRTQADRL